MTGQRKDRRLNRHKGKQVSMYLPANLSARLEAHRAATGIPITATLRAGAEIVLAEYRRNYYTGEPGPE